MVRQHHADPNHIRPLEGPKMAHTRLCKIEGCDNPVRGRGWCGKHYMRWYQHGSPTALLIRRGGPDKFVQDAIRHCGDECLIWPFARNAQGYARHRVNGRVTSAPRVVCELTSGTAPTTEHVCAHSCGNGHLGCVNPKHLRWATHKENNADKFTHGTIARGERNGNVKMSEETARSVRAIIGTMSQREIAALFGVSRSAVRDVKLGRSWGWL